MIVASIMTGTSVDGVDISIVDINTKKILSFNEFEFDKKEIDYIKGFLWPNEKRMNEISEFNYKFSIIVSKYFNKLERKYIDLIEVVVFHGQTVFHDADSSINSVPSTMQLGNGAMLSQMIKKDVLTDLRATDVSVGNNGAPIVGFGDKEFFWENNNIAVFNIGGISNVTIINIDGEITQFDLGPGNALLDVAASELFNISYDANGNEARKGKIIDARLKVLMEDKFLKVEPPKSTGKEKYNSDFIWSIFNKKDNPNNIMATLVEFTKEAILTVGKYVDIENSKIFFAGGGVRNEFLMERLGSVFHKIENTNLFGVDPQARESASFAFFAKYYFERKKIGTGNTKTIFGALYKY